jgi:hypothetical protein
MTSLAEWAHLVANLKFGRHVPSHKQLVKKIITGPSFKSPTCLLDRTKLIFY